MGSSFRYFLCWPLLFDMTVFIVVVVVVVFQTEPEKVS